MILLIDNCDSFTCNLVQRLGEIDPALSMVRPEEVTDEAERKKYDPTATSAKKIPSRQS